jgi:hypothetical protein
MRTTILVLANKTAGSEELFAALAARAAKGPIRLELVAPPDAPGPDGRAEAQARLDQALARAAEAGWEATGRVGPPDALGAVLDAYDPRRHDEIIISTLPPSVSHWLGIDLPARVARSTNALVSHVAVPERPTAPSRR